MTKLTDLIGQKYFRLTVIRYAGLNRHGKSQWVCKCDCGNESVVSNSSLKCGTTKSCGCLHKENASILFSKRKTKHGLSKTNEYNMWLTMISRCHNKNHTAYYKYGAKGIQVCDEWRKSFTAFLNDVGKRPSIAHSLDRYPNRNGNYEKSNIRWATPKEQTYNSSVVKIVEVDGIKMCKSDAAKYIGLTPSVFNTKFKKGVTPQQMKSQKDQVVI